MIGRLKGKKGFTLVELLIVVGLVAVILLPISMFFTSNLGYFYRENDKINSQVEAGRIMELLTVRAMEAVKYEPEDGSHVFTTGEGKWVFKHEGSKLYYNTNKKSAGSLTELSGNVSYLDIDTISNSSKIIGVDITLEVTYKREKCELKNKIYFRN